MKSKSLSLTQRLRAPSPTFFKKIQRIGLIMGSIGGAILAAPFTLPAAVLTAAGYLATAGLVASAVSATTVEKE